MAENDQRIVKIVWADRTGKACENCQATLGHTIDQVASSNTGEKHTALWYSFNRTESEYPIIDPALGISKFWFTVEENGQTATYDQDGVGFAIQDALVVANSTCFTFDNNGLEFKWQIAVRSASNYRPISC
jgi:hypothetical protein